MYVYMYAYIDNANQMFWYFGAMTFKKKKKEKNACNCLVKPLV